MYKLTSVVLLFSFALSSCAPQVIVKHLPQPGQKANAEKTVAANLERYLGLLGVPVGVASRRRLRTLREACLSGMS